MELSDITVSRTDDEMFTLQKGDEVIGHCICCGKRLNAKAAARLVTKLVMGEVEWRDIYVEQEEA